MQVLWLRQIQVSTIRSDRIIISDEQRHLASFLWFTNQHRTLDNGGFLLKREESEKQKKSGKKKKWSLPGKRRSHNMRDPAFIWHTQAARSGSSRIKPPWPGHPAFREETATCPAGQRFSARRLLGFGRVQLGEGSEYCNEAGGLSASDFACTLHGMAC